MARPTFPREWGRKDFNAQARAALVADNREVLQHLALELTDRQVSHRRGPSCKEYERAPAASHLVEDMRQAGYGAAIEAANAYTGADFYRTVGAAISNAMQEHIRAGGRRDANAWRGGYDSHTRRFGSEQHTHGAAVALADAMDGEAEPIAEEATEEIDKREQRDTKRAADAVEQTLTKQAERVGDIDARIASSATDVAASAAERTSHDGGHADDERLNPKDDGEAGYGVDGATRGLYTGTVVPSAYWIAEQLAHAEQPGTDQAFLAAVDKAGGLENWISKDGNRKHARQTHESRYAGIRREVRQRAAALILAVGADTALQAAWLAADHEMGRQRTVDPGKPGGTYRAEPVTPPPASGPGIEAVTGVVSAAWPKDAPTGAKGRYFSPVTVWRSYWETVTVSGHSWPDHQRNVRAWKQSHRRGPALSLLDLAGDGVSLRTVRPRPVVEWGWITRAAASLLDGVDV